DLDDVDLLDLRRVERERPLDADAEGVLADGESLAGARALALDHDALELLDVRAQLPLLEALDRLAHRRKGRRPPGMVPQRSAEADAQRSAEADAVRRPVDEEDLADQVLPRHRPPLARVAR